MTRYLLPLAFVALFFFAGQNAFAGHHGHGGYGGHHHHQAFYPGSLGGFGLAGRYGAGYGIGYGAYGAGYGLAVPAYGGLGYGYSGFAAPFYGYPQSYFASPGYGQWGGFGPGF